MNDAKAKVRNKRSTVDQFASLSLDDLRMVFAGLGCGTLTQTLEIVLLGTTKWF